MAVSYYAIDGGSSSTINNGPIPADREIERLRQEQDDYLDEALQEAFPASDPIAPGHPHSKIAG